MLGSRQAKPSNTTSPIARFASCGLRSSAWSHKAEIEAQIEHFCGDRNAENQPQSRNAIVSLCQPGELL